MQQDQLAEIDRKLQLVIEQLAVSNRNRYGRSTEKMESSQLSFQEVDGELVIIFNEAEALADENAGELTEEVIQKRSKKAERQTCRGSVRTSKRDNQPRSQRR